MREGENVQRPTFNVQRSTEGTRAALEVATRALLSEMTAVGHWEGELSSSALSTATAVVALGQVGVEADAQLIRGGLRWLAEHQNADGGWGDTVKSKSNISTTALGWAAFGAVSALLEGGAPATPGPGLVTRTAASQELRPPTDPFIQSVERAAAWLDQARGGSSLPAAIAARYGKDRTFSVPILMTLALGGRIGWEHVMPLPFELAALPHQFFGALQLPVVSYALPALIAIGQAVHRHRPPRNPLVRWLRGLVKVRTLRVLESIQPENGGFLEATPLTSFVTMALASVGHAPHRVAQRGAMFLRAAVREDGSWPIDTNLATWVTTLSIKALAHQPGALAPEQRLTLREWLLGQQYRVEHPYTHAAPGGWAWTHLPGGVPDADDTAGALLALAALGTIDGPTAHAGRVAVCWLLQVQNRDGGIPTFCRGWGALPFDRSAPDLTAHALRAWSAWLPQLDEAAEKRTLRAIERALHFLAKTQRADGSWLPLWFGNEHAADDENPVHGTAHVVIALRELRERGFALPARMLDEGVRWLAEMQAADGGWSGARGGPPSVEETALAVEALAGTAKVSAVDRGVAWLVERVESGAWREPAPIGFYFAKLWYHERLYPLIWTVGALGRVAALTHAE